MTQTMNEVISKVFERVPAKEGTDGKLELKNLYKPEIPDENLTLVSLYKVFSYRKGSTPTQIAGIDPNAFDHRLEARVGERTFSMEGWPRDPDPKAERLESERRLPLEPAQIAEHFEHEINIKGLKLVIEHCIVATAIK